MKSNSVDEEKEGGNEDRPTPLLPLTSPKRGGSPFLLPSASPPVADFNLVSPSRSTRHNVKFVNGQLVGGVTPSQAAPSLAPLAFPSVQGATPLESPPLLPSPSGKKAFARPKPLNPPMIDLPLRERANTTGTVSPSPSTLPFTLPSTLSPLSTQSPLSAGLPAVHRGSPSLHRRYPSVPAISPQHSAPTTPTPLTPVTPGDPQRRGLRSRWPSVSTNESPPAIPSSRSNMRLPALQTTLEDGSASSQAIAPVQTEMGDSHRGSVGVRPAGVKGLGRKMSSISASLASSDLPPVTPLHLRGFSALPFTSPLLPLPLSPRSAKLLTSISPSELEDLHVVIQAMLDRYREMEWMEQQSTKRESLTSERGEQRPRMSISVVDSSLPPSSVDSSPPAGHGRSSVESHSLMPSPHTSVGSVPSPNGAVTPPLTVWPSWLPDEEALQEDLDRIADQLGIRRAIIAHTLRKVINNQPQPR